MFLLDLIHHILEWVHMAKPITRDAPMNMGREGKAFLGETEL